MPTTYNSPAIDSKQCVCRFVRFPGDFSCFGPTVGHYWDTTMETCASHRYFYCCYSSRGPAYGVFRVRHYPVVKPAPVSPPYASIALTPSFCLVGYRLTQRPLGRCRAARRVLTRPVGSRDVAPFHGAIYAARRSFFGKRRFLRTSLSSGNWSPTGHTRLRTATNPSGRANRRMPPNSPRRAPLRSTSTYDSPHFRSLRAMKSPDRRSIPACRRIRAEAGPCVADRTCFPHLDPFVRHGETYRAQLRPAFRISTGICYTGRPRSVEKVCPRGPLPPRPYRDIPRPRYQLLGWKCDVAANGNAPREGFFEETR